MLNWVYAPELVSCLFFAILLSFTFRRRTRAVRTVIFCLSMVFALVVTGLNVTSIWFSERADELPVFAVRLVTDLYFIFLPLMSGSIILYELVLMYEREDPRRHLPKMAHTMGYVYAAHLAMLVCNWMTGAVYRVDEAGVYHRGPLILLVYAHFLIYILIAMIGFFDQRKYIDLYQRRVLRTVPILSVAIVGLSYIWPQLQLNGTAMAASSLLIFGNFQNRRINTDQLTRLGTRDRFYLELRNLFRQQKPAVVIAVKLLNFKHVNQIFGQMTGDRFLKAIADKLRDLDSFAYVYRFSGVHFIIISRKVEEQERLFNAAAGIFRDPISIGDTRCAISAAIADIRCPEMASDVNEVIESLEYAIALSAKAGRPVRFDREIRRKREHREHLIALMRRALQDDGFFLQYQPVYDCAQQRFVSAEVLLRLRDDDGTVVMPGEFIPVAEETGLIVSISWLVLEKVCAFLKAHDSVSALSINMSVQQFQEPGVITRIMHYIDAYGIRPEQICLEITERTFSSNEQKVCTVMRTLTSYGVRFHLDDFGTGYSNLAAVFTMPFQYVKLDRSIITALSRDRRTQLMVKGMIDSFAQTGTGLVAEGVETASEAEAVRGLGIRRIQGYYFSRPIPEEEYLALLAEQGGSDLTIHEADPLSTLHLSS